MLLHEGTNHSFKQISQFKAAENFAKWYFFWQGSGKGNEKQQIELSASCRSEINRHT